LDRKSGPRFGAVHGPVSAMIREPLVHFILLSGLLFGVAAVLDVGGEVVEISQAELDWRILQVEAEQGRSLDAEERRQVREAYIDERILVREAQALGLEADERIDDILVQKMLHVLSGDVIQPTEEELAAYYGENLSRYSTDAAVTVDELVLPLGGPFPRQLREGVLPENLPESARIAYRRMEDLSSQDLAALFGEDAARATLTIESGGWVQASISVRGEHWLRVRERAGSVVQPLRVVRDAVRADWIADQEQVRLRERVDDIRSRYSVVIDGEALR